MVKTEAPAGVSTEVEAREEYDGDDEDDTSGDADPYQDGGQGAVVSVGLTRFGHSPSVMSVEAAQ